MTAKELLHALETIVKNGDGEARVTAGHLNITHHLSMIKNVGTSAAKSFMDDDEKKLVVVLDLYEETYNSDEDLDDVERIYED